MSKFQFLRKLAKFKSQTPAMLDRMANNAVHQFKVVNFDVSGFVDTTVNKWAPIKHSDGRRPLVDTGRMRGSITVLRRSQYSRVVGSNVPYAAYQNTGTKHLPARKFIGNSKVLEKKNGKVIIETISKIV